MNADLQPDPALAARAAAEAPTMALEPADVLVAARRHVRRRTVGRLGGALGGVATVVALAVGLAGVHGSTPPATHDSSAPTASHDTTAPAAAVEPAGDTRVVTLAEGIVATTTPVARGVASLDLGTYSDRHAILVAAGPSATTARIDVVSGTRPAVAGTPGPLSAVPVGDGGDPSRQQVYVGAVPADQPAARAFLVSTTGFVRADGSVVHALELPLFGTLQQPFAGAGGAGRWYAVGLLDDAAARQLDGESGVLLALSDGSVVDPGCDTHCEDTAALVTAVRALLGAPAPWATVPQGAPPAPTQLADGVLAAAGPFTGRSVSEDGGTASTELGTFGDGDATISRSGVGSGSELAIASQTGENVDLRGYRAAFQGDESASSDWALDGGGVMRFGVTPTAAPRAFYWSTRSLTRPDGTRTHVVELPTFTLPDFAGNPVGADRRWYFVDDTGAVAGNGRPATGGVLFGTTDGHLVDPACGDASCPGSAAQPYYPAVAQLLTKPRAALTR